MKIDVNELMRAASITANMRPRRPVELIEWKFLDSLYGVVECKTLVVLVGWPVINLPF